MKNTNMTSLVGLLCAFIIILASIDTRVGAAEEFKVGDVDGWRQPAATNESSMYTQWATKNRFHVGDSLRFEYKNDSVLVVDKWGYYHCNTSNPISAFKDGNSIVNLDNPGPMYFISGDPDHCKNGQRLLVDVMGLHLISHTPPSSIATPPQPFPASSSPSPSPLSSAAGVVSVSVAPVSVLVALIVANIVALVWHAT